MQLANFINVPIEEQMYQSFSVISCPGTCCFHDSWKGKPPKKNITIEMWHGFICGFILEAKCANTDESEYCIYRPQLHAVNKRYLFKSVGKL